MSMERVTRENLAGNAFNHMSVEDIRLIDYLGRNYDRPVDIKVERDRKEKKLKLVKLFGQEQVTTIAA